MLSPQLLELLRDWWRIARPPGWLFPGRDPMLPLTTRQLNRAVHAAAAMTEIKKRVTPQTLRHSFATHLLEQNIEYQRMFDAARKRRFDVLLVWRYDRFARSMQEIAASAMRWSMSLGATAGCQLFDLVWNDRGDSAVRGTACTNFASIRYQSGEGRRVGSRSQRLLLLIRPDEFGLRQDMPLHGLFELRLGWPAEVGKDGVESEELMEVAVAADRRAWPAVARPLPVVQSLARAGGQRLPLHSLA
jgi:hypothetical protein